MDEKKKLLVILGVIGLIILLIIGLAIKEGIKRKELYQTFESAFHGEEKTLLYVGKTGCSWCNLLDPSIQEMKERYHFDYLYINLKELGSNYTSKMLSELGLTEIGTPYLAVIQNGKVVDSKPGYVDYDKLFEFAQKNEIISKDAKLLLNYIGLKEYQELLAGKEKSVIVVGQSTCGYCVQAKLILNQIADENDVDIHYLNISYLEKEEGETFQNSLDYFKKDSWGTPVMIVVQDGKMVDILESLNSKEGYISFLKKQGVL